MKNLQQIIDRSRSIAFLGGAGVSTESGIPDFRSEEGFYAGSFMGLEPEEILSETFFYLHPDIFFDFYRQRILHLDAKPNAAHMALVRLEEAGKISGVVTQNIDGLHRQAGSVRLFEIHGSVHENTCMACGAAYTADWLAHTDGIPRCPSCGGMVRPDIVLYGEALNPYVLRGAKRVIAEADTLIVAGTSLSVEPAASLIDGFYGRELVVINREETPAERQATLIIRGNAAETMALLHL